jgi:hypothetical protein
MKYYPAFDLATLKQEAPDALVRWRKRWKELEPVLGLYFTDLESVNQTLAARFLSMTQCLEAYHRIAVGTRELETGEFDARVEKLLDSCPPEWRKWLKTRLEYGYEVSFRRRLRELGGLVMSLDGVACRRMGRFINNVVTTRNYHVHYDSSLRTRALEGVRLWNAYERLRCLVELLLVREMGFTGKPQEGGLSRRVKVLLGEDQFE